MWPCRVFPVGSGRLTRPSDSLGTKAVLTCLADIARAHDASISQVALNWLMARDGHVIPIPGATKPHHAMANLDALAWRLSETEFDAIDRASATVEQESGAHRTPHLHL